MVQTVNYWGVLNRDTNYNYNHFKVDEILE